MPVGASTSMLGGGGTTPLPPVAQPVASARLNNAIARKQILIMMPFWVDFFPLLRAALRPMLFKSASYNVPEFRALCLCRPAFRMAPAQPDAQRFAGKVAGLRFSGFRSFQWRVETICPTPDTCEPAIVASPPVSFFARSALSISGRRTAAVIPSVPPEKPSM